MEPLVASDPSRLGGHRLVGRLGSGGMGVVYLARAIGGELAAVKMIQPEYAARPEFRARFRREVAATRHVTSPWLVPVLDADAEAEVPWLATAYVPGPSLDEAVAACGPLPIHAVRTLGKVLARALGAVHDAGLVHRDVKPGNVLLALDGPRLIDFGIARPTAVEETALTSDGVVVGSPGFLSPEQAQARPVGPASDVYSLGCVLAYAATGRPPFGTGTVDALLYRTVHDAPDLDPVEDAELRTLLERCLAKERQGRPTAAEVDTELAGDAPESSIDWLPDAVVGMVVDRSAEMLALPGIERTEVTPSAGASGKPGRREPGRRRFLTLTAGGSAVVAVGGGTALWRLVRADGRDAAAGSARGRRWVIGVQADLTGPQREFGRAQERGARLAVEEFNSRRRKPFTLILEVVDDRGEAERARSAARHLAGNRDVLAVLGPTGYASAQGAVEVYEGVGLPLLTVSELSLSAAASVLLAEPRVYFQAGTLTAYASHMTVDMLQSRGARHLGLMVDRAGRAVGWDSATLAGQAARSSGLELYARVVPAAATELGPVVADMLDRDVDSFYYTGTPERASTVARALAASGFRGPRFLDPASATTGFVAAAGSTAEGWQLVAPYTSSDADGIRGFAAVFRRRYGEVPSTWAAEAYDVTRLIIDRLTALTAGDGRRASRHRLVNALANADFTGLATTYAFDEQRWLKAPRLHHYRVVDGRFTYLGLAGADRS